MARVATSDAAAGTGVVVTAGTSDAVTAGRRNAAGGRGSIATSRHNQIRWRRRRRQTSRQATARPLSRSVRGRTRPATRAWTYTSARKLANLELACSSRGPSHLHECTVPLENGQRYLFTAAYERDGVLGARSAPVSGWPDSCNPELFHSPGTWPGSNSLATVRRRQSLELAGRGGSRGSRGRPGQLEVLERAVRAGPYRLRPGQRGLRVAVRPAHDRDRQQRRQRPRGFQARDLLRERQRPVRDVAKPRLRYRRAGLLTA